MPAGSIPMRVEKLVKEIEQKNPSYSEAQAWKTAWSVYCAYVEPGSEHCHKSASAYLRGQRGRGARGSSKKRKATTKRSSAKPTQVTRAGLTLMADGTWR